MAASARWVELPSDVVDVIARNAAPEALATLARLETLTERQTHARRKHLRRLSEHPFSLSTERVLGTGNGTFRHVFRNICELHLVDLANGVASGAISQIDDLAVEVQAADVNDHNGVAFFAKACSHRPLVNLRQLTFEAYHVGDDGAVALAAACENGAFPALTMLCLSESNIGGVGAVALARAGENLTSLHLSNNALGDDGLKMFAEACLHGALRNIVALSVWDLNNSIEKEGCEALLTVLQKNALPKLEELCFDGLCDGQLIFTGLFEEWTETEKLLYEICTSRGISLPIQEEDA